uniref:Ig-like domain-containing protein n=1 Tax=Hafnia alvei TaxID=569 RepID=UPI0026EC058C
DIKVTVTLKDGNTPTANPVTGLSSATLSGMVAVANADAKTSTNWVESATKGTYVGTYVARAADTGLKATLTIGSATKDSATYAITAGDASGTESSLAISADRIVANNNATSTLNTDNATLTLSVLDANKNGVTGLADKITFMVSDSNGAVVSTGVTIDKIDATSTDGQYTARIYGNKTDTYTIKVKIDDDYLGSLSKQLVLYTYSFALNTTTKSIIVDGNYQFIVQAIPTDAGSVEDVSSGVSWTSGNTSVATVATTGIATGLSNGSATITALSGTYNGITYNDLSAVLTVKGSFTSATFGTPTGDEPTKYTVGAPSYSLWARGSGYVDGIGTSEQHSGGNGGSPVTITKLDKLTTIDITTGYLDQKWNQEPYVSVVTKIVFHYSDGTSQIIGGNGDSEVLNKKNYTETVIPGYILQGFDVTAKTYVHSIAFRYLPVN